MSEILVIEDILEDLINKMTVLVAANDDSVQNLAINDCLEILNPGRTNINIKGKVNGMVGK